MGSHPVGYEILQDKEFMLQKHSFFEDEFGNLDSNCIPLIYRVVVETTVCPSTFFLPFLITNPQLLLGT